MGSKLLKNVSLNGEICDIFIKNGIFERICVAASSGLENDNLSEYELIDCSNLAILPAFYNAHTHAAMSLMRSAGSGLSLQKWLKNLAPFEAKLDYEIIKAGARLAILEMIKSGCVFFADMYFYREAALKAAEEMGVRACIGAVLADLVAPEIATKNAFEFLENYAPNNELINIAAMPHSIYLASQKAFERANSVATERNLSFHTHLSETVNEVENCRQKHGINPGELMQKWGVLNERFSAAHCVHLSEDEIKIFRDNKANIITCPSSNLKLNSGIPPISKFLSNGVNTAIGTDGAASNDALSLHSETRLAALLLNAQSGDGVSIKNIFKMANENAAKAYNINGGKIAENYAADAILVDLDNHRLATSHDFLASFIYAADSAAIKSVLCAGKFLMQNGKIDGEEDIIKEAKNAFLRLKNS